MTVWNWPPSGGGNAANVAGMFFPDLPPALPSALDDEFTGTSVATKWQDWDAGAFMTATIDQSTASLNLAGTGPGIYTWSGLYQAVPGSEYAVYTKAFVRSTGQAAWSNAGLFFAAAGLPGAPATTDFVTQAVYWGNVGGNVIGLQRDNWSNYNDGAGVFVNAPLLTTASMLGLPIYFRARVSGANIGCDYSLDGRQWVPTTPGLVAAPFTPAYIGLPFQAQAGVAMSVQYQFFRVFAGAGTSGFNATQIGRLT